MLGLEVDRLEDWSCGQMLDGAEIAVLPYRWELCLFKTSDSKYFLHQPPQPSPSLFPKAARSAPLWLL